MSDETGRRRYLLGILVGGESSRMGGRAKGSLKLGSGMTIVSTIASEFLTAAPDSPVVLLGTHAAYAGLGFRQLADLADAPGPIAGVHSLLLEAEKMKRIAVLVGCDMPFLNASLFTELLTQSVDAKSLAPRSKQHWEPLFSRHHPRPGLSALKQCLACQRFSLQEWLAGCETAELRLSAAERERLRDWDTPEDVTDGS